MHKLIYKTFFFILILNFSAIPSVLAKEYRIINVDLPVDLGDKEDEDRFVTDYYLNAGKTSNIKKGMLLDVYRPKLIIDSLTGENKKISVLIGKVKVINVDKDISVARIDSLEPLSSNPIVNYRTVMIGDYIKPPAEPSPKEPAEGSSKKENASDALPKTSIIIPANILFDMNSWKLKPEASTALKKMAEHVKSPKDILLIEGHTCSVGTKKHNLRLSRKRAESAAKYLKTLKKIHGKQIITIGHGGEIPIAPNDTEKNRVKNRRVEFKIISANQVSFVK